MAELRPTFQNIANAIREKNGLTDTYTPEQMPAAIKAIEGGGGGTEPPAEALVLSGNCSNWYNSVSNKWFFDTFKNKMSSKDITTCDYMFEGYEGETFPFDINIANPNGWQEYYRFIFSDSRNLITAPNIIITSPYTEIYSIDMKSVFDGCNKLKNVPVDMFDKIANILKDAPWSNLNSGYAMFHSFFSNCYWLEEVPKMVGLAQINIQVCLDQIFSDCYSLKQVDLPIPKKLEWQRMYKPCFSTARLRHLTFDKNREYYIEGTVLNWDQYTLNLTDTGYAQVALDPEKNLPQELMINDDISYQSLKNNPDAWVYYLEYSFYNHDAALETIKTLPNTSGSNIIKFTGNSGIKTDGGAINTLTPEEIAIATAKGFTVAFE